MKIAIDVTRAIIETAGIGRYTYEITQSLLDQAKTDEFLIYSTHFRSSAEKKKKFLSFARKNVKLKRLPVPGRVKEIAWAWPVDLLGKFLEGSEVLFAPSFFEAGLGFKIRQVVTIHDMTTFLFPTQRGPKLSRFLSDRTVKVCQKAEKIICVSQSTKKDLLEHTIISKDKPEVIYPGLKIFPESNKKLPRNLEPGKYILSVGTIEPRKNLIGLFKAYSMLEPTFRQKFPLVIAGGKGWNDEKIYSEIKALGLENEIIFTGFVSDSVLAQLYENCAIFAYVSLYEGFGLPILEALSFGCPVITSNVSSMPEVSGEAALLVEPTDSKEIAAAMKRLLTDEDLQKTLSKKALIQAGKFSWQGAAIDTLDVLRKAVEKS